MIDRFAAKLTLSERLTSFSNKMLFFFNWIIKLSSVILCRNEALLNVQERLSLQNLTFSEARKKSSLLSFFVCLIRGSLPPQLEVFGHSDTTK